jgi:hypothetical protein
VFGVAFVLFVEMASELKGVSLFHLPNRNPTRCNHDQLKPTPAVHHLTPQAKPSPAVAPSPVIVIIIVV